MVNEGEERSNQPQSKPMPYYSQGQQPRSISPVPPNQNGQKINRSPMPLQTQGRYPEQTMLPRVDPIYVRSEYSREQLI